MGSYFSNTSASKTFHSKSKKVTIRDMDRSNSYVVILLLMLAVNFSIMAQDKNEINILFIGSFY